MFEKNILFYCLNMEISTGIKKTTDNNIELKLLMS